MSDKGADPMALWRKTIGEMEKGLNALSNQTMTSPEFSKLMNQLGVIAAGAQKQFGDFMEQYLVMINLPTRAQMGGIVERLQTIESELNDVKALLQQMKDSGPLQPSSPGAPRPPRTKRPPQPSSGEQT